jgi:hypothetical protein
VNQVESDRDRIAKLARASSRALIVFFLCFGVAILQLYRHPEVARAVSIVLFFLIGLGALQTWAQLAPISRELRRLRQRMPDDGGDGADAKAPPVSREE